MKELLEQILNEESRIDKLSRQFPDIDKEVVQHYYDKALPVEDKANINFVLSQHMKGKVSPSDHESIKHTLSIYRRNKDVLGKLSDYDSFRDLQIAAKPVAQRNRSAKEIFEEEAPVVYNEDGFKTRLITTHRASIQAAKLDKKNRYFRQLNGKANWCLSSASVLGGRQFDKYSEAGSNPIYVQHNKADNSQHVFVDAPNMSLYECYRDEAQSPVVASASHAAANIISDSNFAKTPIAKAIIKKHPEIKFFMSKIKPNVSKTEIEQHIKTSHHDIAGVALHMPNADINHIHLALQTGDNKVIEHALSHPKCPKSILEDALRDKDGTKWKALAALKNPTLTPDMLQIAINHPSGSRLPFSEEAAMSSIPTVALQHINCSEDNIESGINHSNLLVKAVASNHHNLTPRLIDKLLSYRGQYDDIMHGQAMMNNNARPEQIHEVLTSGKFFSQAKECAVKHPNALKATLEIAAHDRNHNVADIATERLNTEDYIK
jgi:hypothetical protein